MRDRCIDRMSYFYEESIPDLVNEIFVSITIDIREYHFFLSSEFFGPVEKASLFFRIIEDIDAFIVRGRSRRRIRW